MALSDKNKLDFVPVAAESHFLPTFDWRTIGALWARGPSASSSGKALTSVKLSGRCAFTVREGFDPIDASSTGRVVEGNGDLGFTLRRGSVAFSLTAGNLAYHAGLDDPLASAQTRVGEASVPSLKLTVAKEYSEDSYAALSWDLAQKKPEIAFGWAGDTFAQQSSVVVHADPLMRTYKLSALIAFPGPDWRDILFNESTREVEYPPDDGSRHRLWLSHIIKDRQWGYKTRVGGAFDLGKIVNNIGEWIDDVIEPMIPPLVWRIPLMPNLYDLIVPPQDEDQVRYKVKGWDLEVVHEFGVKGSQLGLAKHFQYATLRSGWHTGTKEASITYKKSAVSLSARIGRQDGGWGKPSLMLQVEPLSLL